MNNKDSISKRLGRFIAGKGFYIVLFICVAVIGVSTWVLISNGGARTDAQEAANITVTAGSAAATTAPITTPAATSDTAAGNAASVTEDEEAAMSVIADDDENRENPLKNEDEDMLNLGEEAAAATPEPTMTPSEQALNAARSTFIWPVSGTMERDFGNENNPIYDKTMADWRSHSGIDIAAQIGTKVMAASYGTVESISSDYWYGTTVVISHGDGLKSVYSNLAATPAVSVGDTVSAGSVIGSVGNTANAEIGEVAHLHFEILLDDVSVDPMEYLP